MRTVIFDLDGTLADTSGDLLAAANACFREMGLGDLLTRERDAGTALRGGKAMLTAGLERAGKFEEALVEEFYPVLLSHYRDAIDHHTVMYPGAMDAVEQLKSDGFGVGICTNKPEALAEKLMQSLGVRDAFHSLVGADTLPVRKPDPAPLHHAVEALGAHRVLYVGDSETDAETARRAGLPFALFTEGYRKSPVAELPHDMAFTDFADLPGIFDRLLPAAA